jgi:hypothetical protein
MTVDPIPLRPRRVTPNQRPTIATPVLVSKSAEKCIAEIDRDLDCLYCVHGTLAGAEGMPDEALEALATLRHRMKRNVDILYSLG